MPKTLCPACGFKVDHDTGVHTVGCPRPECRVIEFLPEAHHA